MRRFKGLLLAAAVLAAPAIAADAPKAGALIVYDKALGEGWQNWSWARTELSLELNGSQRRPIRVDAGPWQALYLHHDPISTAPYKKLSFLIQGGAPGGQKVRIFAISGGKIVGEGKLLTLKADGWTQVETPLSALGAGNIQLDGLWFQNASDAEIPQFYVTDISIS